jgi:hypothetical protein
MAAAVERSGLGGRLAADLAALDAELAEVDLLITQATAEAERHEQKRAAATERLTAAQGAGEAPQALLEQATAVIALTRRAAVMEAQVEVLVGKRKTLGRYRDALSAYGADVDPDAAGPGTAAVIGASLGGGGVGASRVVLAAQEELRREIARAMHDGPAQSLTNIVLQAQIVERIVDRDPGAARAEVRQLIEMVQRTLDATKSFIFEVRPMVLDDLGLVPTLRGAARDRARRSGVAIAFDSFGPDRRLPTDLESALFRLVDDALAAFLELGPRQLVLRLDWGDQLEARISAVPAVANAASTGPVEPPVAEPAAPAQTVAERAREGGKRRGRGRGEPEDELPPALAEMIAQRRDDELAATARAMRAPTFVLPPAAWDELRARAESLNLRAELLDDGSTFQVTLDLAPVAPAGAPA